MRRNHQQDVPFFSVLGVIFAALSMKHRLNLSQNSMLSNYAYHQYDATPLMCSILSGCFEATLVLLAAGARTDLQNARGQTAEDFAKDVVAPDHIVSALVEATGSPPLGENCIREDWWNETMIRPTLSCRSQ